MRILHALATILIAVGILGSAIAEEETWNGIELHSQEKTAESIKDFDIFIGKIDFNDTNVFHQVVDNYIKAKCAKNGGPQAYDVAKVIPHYLSEKSLLGMDDLKRILEEILITRRLSSFGRLTAVVQKHCQKVPALKEHIKYVLDSIEPCMDPEVKDGTDFLLNDVVNAFLEFFCEDGARRLTNFIVHDGMECLASKRPALINCGVYAKSTFPILQWPRVSPGVTISDCEIIKEYGHCLVKTFSECEDTLPAAIIESLLNKIIEATSCHILDDKTFTSL